MRRVRGVKKKSECLNDATPDHEIVQCTDHLTPYALHGMCPTVPHGSTSVSDVMPWLE